MEISEYIKATDCGGILSTKDYLYPTPEAQEIQEPVKEYGIKNLKAVQFELRPFFDGEDPTEAKIVEFIANHNVHFL